MINVKTINETVIKLESELEITKEQVDTIRLQKQGVENLTKDLHVEQTTLERDGKFYSVMGCMITIPADKKIDLVDEGCLLHTKHVDFIKWVDKFPMFKEEDKEQARPYSLEEAHKKIQELKDDLAEHGVGLCGMAYLEEHAAYFGFLPIKVFAVDVMEKAFNHEDTKD